MVSYGIRNNNKTKDTQLARYLPRPNSWERGGELIAELGLFDKFVAMMNKVGSVGLYGEKKRVLF